MPDRRSSLGAGLLRPARRRGTGADRAVRVEPANRARRRRSVVIERYEVYCLADRVFYDTLGQSSEHVDFAQCGRPVPDGWTRESDDAWMHLAPRDADVPVQGWKIHLSARSEDIERAL